MNNKTFPFILVTLAQTACSGGTSDTSNELFSDQQARGTFFSSEGIINSDRIGPQPNYWNCNLRQANATVALKSEYQFFHDNSGVFSIGPNHITFSWDAAASAGSGYIDITNHTGSVPVERWFVDSGSTTTFSANIDYAQSLEDLALTSRDSDDASLTCVLYASGEAVNPEDESLLGPLNDIPTNGAEGDNATIAQSLVNVDSDFGLENELWECIAEDGSLDRLLGFFPDGIGATYTTRTGRLERSQFTYSVEESGDVGTVTIDAVVDNQAQQLQLTNLIVERSSQFLATYESTDLNKDVLVSCDRLPTASIVF